MKYNNLCDVSNQKWLRILNNTRRNTGTLQNIKFTTTTISITDYLSRRFNLPVYKTVSVALWYEIWPVGWYTELWRYI